MRSGHLVFVKFGDYGTVAKHLHAGGGENYYAQRYSVEYVGSLTGRQSRVTVLNLVADQPEELLPNGVHSLGIELYRPGKRPRFRELTGQLERLGPDLLIVSAPLSPVLAWAKRRRIDTLPMFFDSFRARGMRARLRHWRLARLLRSPHFRWVANHSLAAAADLVRIGVPSSKVLPIDWPAFDSPSGRPAKILERQRPFRLVFVGQVSIAKGAKDLLLAVDELNRTVPDREYTVTFIGKEIGEGLGQLAQGLAYPDRIRFLGPVPHDDVVMHMQAHDAVVVPSRHDYPEGLPMTIYESFCSRSPLIASDHPMFERKLRDGENCVRFEAGSVPALAGAIRRLSEDAALYARLSDRAEESAARHFCPLKYDQMIAHWLEATPAADAFLGQHAVSRQPQP